MAAKLFYARKDMRGAKVIGGAFAGIHINEDTIDQWVDAYSKSAEIILKKTHFNTFRSPLPW